MPIKIKLNESPADFLDKARTEITRVGGNLIGIKDSGEFSIPVKSGNISGNYEFQGEYISIDITDKPSSVTLEKIESEIQRYMK